MANHPLDLWPESIEVAPMTPAAILLFQAGRLRDRTGGLLHAEVITSQEQPPPEGGDPLTVHRFEIVAPGWNNYRHQLFLCRHGQTLVYPVWIGPGDPDDPGNVWKKASTQEEFTQFVRGLLGSKDTAAVIQSLLALSVEAKAGAGAPAA